MNKFSPKVLKLEAGTHYICQCGQSKNLPFCDGSHKGSDKVPYELKLEEAKEVALCQCKQSGNQPFCDGTHKTLNKT